MTPFCKGNELTEEQIQLLGDLYREACLEGDMALDNFPYTKTYDLLYANFLVYSGVVISQNVFWRRLMKHRKDNCRKSGKLPTLFRKPRRPKVPAAELEPEGAT